jgi:CheY-like chemotaxis protein
MDAYRVLYVEDEPDIHDIVIMSLALDGRLTVKSCWNGADVLAQAAEWRPDVILMDVVMPDMDGPQLLARLRQNPSTADVAVVFMTARTQSHEVEHFRDLGVAGVIAKPFDPLTLAASLRACLQGAPQAA